MYLYNIAQLIAILFAISTLLPSGLPAQDFWQLCNGPYGGTVGRAIETKSGALLISTGNGVGIHRSIDGGLSWTNVLPGTWSSGFQVDFVTGGILASTGGIDESTDDGLTWHSFCDTLPVYGWGQIGGILLLSNGTLLAGVLSDRWSPSASIYRTTDHGNSWEAVKEGSGTRDFAVTKSGAIFSVPAGYGLFRSLDSGSTWQSVDSLIWYKVYAIAQGTKETDLFVGTNSQGLFYSADNGTNWKQLADGPLTSGMRVYSIYVSTFGEDTTVHVGTADGVMISRDYGMTWQQDTLGLFFPKTFGVFQDRAGSMYAGTEGGGIYKRENGDSIWRQMNTGIRGLTHQTAIVYHHQSAKLFFGSAEGGLFQSSDLGENWSFVPVGSAYNMSMLQSYGVGSLNCGTDGTLFLIVGGSEQGLYRSQDGGESWDIRIRNFNASEIAFDRSLGMYTARESLWYSNDTGRSWFKNPTGLNNVNSDAIAIAEFGQIFLGTISNGIFHSTNHGVSWQRFLSYPANSAFSSVHDLGFDSRGKLFAFDYYLFSSADTGRTWLQHSGSSNGSQFRIDNHDNLYILTFDDRILQSTDHGMSWHQIGDELPIDAAGGFAIDSSGYVYFNGHYGEVYRSREPVLASAHEDVKQNLPTKFSLSQNYPNPFNPTTKFEVRIAKYEFVSLRVYNLLGEEVAAPINELKQPGTHTVSWDAAKLPSGVYFYTMTAGAFRETKKLLLLR